MVTIESFRIDARNKCESEAASGDCHPSSLQLEFDLMLADTTGECTPCQESEPP